MNKLYMLPLVIGLALLGGCDFFDDDDDKDRNTGTPPAEATGFTSLFDDAFTRERNGEAVAVNGVDIEDDTTESTFDVYLN